MWTERIWGYLPAQPEKYAHLEDISECETAKSFYVEYFLLYTGTSIYRSYITKVLDVLKCLHFCNFKNNEIMIFIFYIHFVSLWWWIEKQMKWHSSSIVLKSVKKFIGRNQLYFEDWINHDNIKYKLLVVLSLPTRHGKN